MRTIEVIKKEQEQALRDLGYHTVMAEKLKVQVFLLAEEILKLEKGNEVKDDAPPVS